MKSAQVEATVQVLGRRKQNRCRTAPSYLHANSTAHPPVLSAASIGTRALAASSLSSTAAGAGLSARRFHWRRRQWLQEITFSLRFVKPEGLDIESGNVEKPQFKAALPHFRKVPHRAHRLRARVDEAAFVESRENLLPPGSGNRLGGGEDIVAFLHEVAPSGWLGRIEAFSGRKVGEAQCEYLMRLGELQGPGSVAQGGDSEGAVPAQVRKVVCMASSACCGGFGAIKAIGNSSVFGVVSMGPRSRPFIGSLQGRVIDVRAAIDRIVN